MRKFHSSSTCSINFPRFSVSPWSTLCALAPENAANLPLLPTTPIMAEPTESLFTATKTELEWKRNPPAPPTGDAAAAPTPLAAGHLPRPVSSLSGSPSAAEVVLATKSPSWLLRKASGTWHTWLRDSMLEVDLPLNTDTISCLEWHPRESILAVGTWCGYVSLVPIQHPSAPSAPSAPPCAPGPHL